MNTKKRKAMEKSALELAQSISSKHLEDTEWVSEMTDDQASPLEVLISVVTALSERHANLKSYLEQRTGLHIDWIGLDNEISNKKTSIGILFRDFEHPLDRCVISRDLEPFVAELRDLAPGRSDSAVATELSNHHFKLADSSSFNHDRQHGKTANNVLHRPHAR